MRSAPCRLPHRAPSCSGRLPCPWLLSLSHNRPLYSLLRIGRGDPILVDVEMWEVELSECRDAAKESDSLSQ